MIVETVLMGTEVHRIFIPGNSLKIKLLTQPVGTIVITVSPTKRFLVVCVGFVVCDSFNE